MIQRSIKATSYRATPSNYRDCNRVPLEIQPVFARFLLANELEDKGEVESSLQGRKSGRCLSIFNGPSEKTPRRSESVQPITVKRSTDTARD